MSIFKATPEGPATVDVAKELDTSPSSEVTPVEPRSSSTEQEDTNTTKVAVVRTGVGTRSTTASGRPRKPYYDSPLFSHGRRVPHERVK